ncbi:MAG: A/G-specific adenine glycosylase [Rhizobiales bacterium]|nr:A/G-specific adenine glycosylase [Hyphomicrobiales bacterium]
MKDSGKRRKKPLAPPSGEALAGKLLAWYDIHARHLPWRARPGTPADPYAVWLSEIMLQQTTVVTVGPYFRDFLARWPRVTDLAAAPVEDVMAAWAGLGYYSRARNLHACAQTVATEYGGIFPDTEEGLIKLPGIGPYTAAAVAAIAFGKRAVVVDGNIERVVARLFSLETPLPLVKKEIKVCTDLITPERRAGDFAQGLMDLGATICTPRSPSCSRCPIIDFCTAQATGIAETLPRRAPKKKRPTRLGACFWMTRPDGAVLLRRRPPKGLLGGMMEVPTTTWLENQSTEDQWLAQAPASVTWKKRGGLVSHGFTHFELQLVVYEARVSATIAKKAEGIWVPVDQLDGEALPTVMRKVVAHAMSDAGPLFSK